MHKYYFEHGHNNILRFLPDRVRIENYWQKPSHFVLGKTVFRRNHIIADLFARIHFGEKMGTGFERIREICKKENAPFPEIEFNENYFNVTFRQSHEYMKLAGKEKSVEEKISLLNGRQKKAVEYVNQRKFITISGYISLNKVSDKTARRDLNDLVEKGIFMKEGATTGLKFRLTSVSFGQLRSNEVSRNE
jgi:ATP-dependent DNA helicase RecG